MEQITTDFRLVLFRPCSKICHWAYDNECGIWYMHDGAPARFGLLAREIGWLSQPQVTETIGLEEEVLLYGNTRFKSVEFLLLKSLQATRLRNTNERR